MRVCTRCIAFLTWFGPFWNIHFQFSANNLEILASSGCSGIINSSNAFNNLNTERVMNSSIPYLLHTHICFCQAAPAHKCNFASSQTANLAIDFLWRSQYITVGKSTNQWRARWWLPSQIYGWWIIANRLCIITYDITGSKHKSIRPLETKPTGQQWSQQYLT